MNVVLLSAGEPKDPWFSDVRGEYVTKISRMLPFSIEYVKTRADAREALDRKRSAETEALLKRLGPDDFVVLFDEKGKSQGSIEFSNQLQRVFQSGKKRIVLVVGGAFGVAAPLKARANLTLALSSMTMNHLVAQTVVLEQTYRAMTIWKGLPYHNA